VKSERAFDSAIVDARGRIASRAVTPEGARATLVATIRLGTGDAPATRFGNGFGWACVLAWLACGIARLARRRWTTPRPRETKLLP
jgi:apolipoprotein N-acyltransferase